MSKPITSSYYEHFARNEPRYEARLSVVWSWEEVLGRGGEGSRTLMWTRRVEWERAALHPTNPSPRAGGWKFGFLPGDKMRLAAGRSDFLWAPYITPAPVCGSWRDVKP